jgi:hypothetical protein
MTPKEKAEQLVKMYAKLIWNEKEFKFPLYRKCAFIAVDEILKVCEKEITNCSDKTFFYWQEVKQEIEKL